MVDLTISRFFEPAPEVRIEARYTFTWRNGGLDSITLSQREDADDGYNSQFRKVEDLDLADVPDDVVVDACERLADCANELTTKHGCGPAVLSDSAGESKSNSEERSCRTLSDWVSCPHCSPEHEDLEVVVYETGHLVFKCTNCNRASEYHRADEHAEEHP